jgi:hypothetical protein
MMDAVRAGECNNGSQQKIEKKELHGNPKGTNLTSAEYFVKENCRTPSILDLQLHVANHPVESDGDVGVKASNW